MKNMIDYSDRGVVWYAMKTTHKREMQAKAYLDSQEIECFVPMEESVITKLGRKRLIQKPIIYNLIFVKSDISQLTKIKADLSYLHNRLTSQDGVLSPIIVPTEQMEQFVNAIENHFDKITITDMAQSCLGKGTSVRIIDGEFKGYEGELEKIKGKRDRRVTLRIGDLIAYKVDVDAKFIEVIKKSKSTLH